MSTEDNKALMRRFLEEVFNKKNLAAIDEFIAPNHVDHTLPFLRTMPRSAEDVSSDSVKLTGCGLNTRGFPMPEQAETAQPGRSPRRGSPPSPARRWLASS